MNVAEIMLNNNQSY